MTDEGKAGEGPDLTAGIAYTSLAPGVPVRGRAGEAAVLVVRLGDDVHAIGATCTHWGGPLDEGLVVDGTVRCPWHHACFDLRSGAAIGAPALADVPCFEVQRVGSLVQVSGKPRAAARATKKISPPHSVVIVGAGGAGAACAERLRKEGYGGPIALFGSEDPSPVDRPNLSKDYLAGKAEEAWIPLGDRGHWADLRVDLVPNGRVTGIDVKGQQVTVCDGRVQGYGALLLATGSEPVRLAVDGADLPHVHVLRTLADARAIIARTAKAKRAVVIGASFIGLEAAASLVQRGLEVHVVAPGSIPLAKVLGDELGRHIRSIHEAKGVVFHAGTRPTRIREHDVVLDNGETLAADLVVAGIGVKPRLSLAEAAGLRIDDATNGVTVDEQLRTSAPAVWAAGDIASFLDARSGDRARVEHWQVAQRQGEHVARAMLGIASSYRDVPFFWSAHHEFAIHYMGHAEGFDEAVVHGSLAGNDAAVAYRKNGKILAVATLNRDRLSLEIERALEQDDDAQLRSLLER